MYFTICYCNTTADAWLPLFSYGLSPTWLLVVIWMWLLRWDAKELHRAAAPLPNTSALVFTIQWVASTCCKWRCDCDSKNQSTMARGGFIWVLLPSSVCRMKMQHCDSTPHAVNLFRAEEEGLLTTPCKVQDLKGSSRAWCSVQMYSNC